MKKQPRRFFSIVLCIIMLTSTALAATPSDITRETALEKAVVALMDAGAVQCYEDGSFRPDNTLSRAQICSMVVRLIRADGAKSAVSKFKDLAGYDWAKPYIDYAAQNGIANGYGNGAFKPAQEVTFAQMVTFIVRACGYNDSGIAGALLTAKSLNLFDNVAVPSNPESAAATRAQAAMVLYNAMSRIKADTNQDTGKQYVVRDDWADDVKNGINDLIAMYGSDSPNYDPNSYAVFDFDDTCAIFDVAVAERYHRLQTMQFQFTPEELPGILATGFGDLDVARSSAYSKDGVSHTYREWIDDITAAYTYLWNKYGPFDYKGLSSKKQALVHADPMWAEFAVKIQVLPKVAMASEGDLTGYPCYKYWNTDMTLDEAYYVSRSALETYKNRETKQVSWTTSERVASKVGVVETSWTEGVSVSQNIVELYKALHDNGIDVWVVSASGTDQIRAAVDTFGLHNYTTGIIAYTNLVKDGVNVNGYDYEAGAAWYTDGAGWKQGNIAICAQPQAVGKTAAINNALVSQYGCGPLAAFGDSAGDYEMLTMYDSLKLVMFCNVGKKVNNAGLLYNVGLYQRDVLGYDLARANANGDTLYVIQGRDENGLRSFRNSNATVYYGKTEEKLLANNDAQTLLNYMATSDMTTAEIIDTFTIKTAADAPGNDTGIAYGFRTFYGGYHSLHY